MIPEYIIVQAGGKGTRLKHLTRNKPKALVPVDNLPMLFHLFRKYPESKYIVIGDYKFDVLERYLAAFGPENIQLVCASGHTGTCSGLREAVSLLPDDQPFLLIWSDLILPAEFNIPDRKDNYIGVAKDFPCRWKYEDGSFLEESSNSFGVAGVFVFENTQMLSNVPTDGEFVRWLAGSGLTFQSLPLRCVKEYGLLSEYQKLESARCRPFNRIYKEGDLFVKEAIDPQGESLAKRENTWYHIVQSSQFKNIPHIVSYEPLKMEYIDGKAVYEYIDLTAEDKETLLGKIVDCLKDVQAIGEVPPDPDSYREAYIGKTFKRLEKVKGLVPFSEDQYIIVNGRRCRNIFGLRDELEKLLEEYLPSSFKLIHGDCTFSNIMIRSNGQVPVLIDPRGYFGHTELYGDPAYDWAKLYYSIVGNYDQFNRKRFSLEINSDSASLEIASNGWEALENRFFQLLDGEVSKRQIKLIHAIIWLSLTTYAWEDYDSICGAFYNGSYYLEEALNLHEAVF